ncbi:putative nuclease HARBI1 [Anabrus simplex]|uniref:putative nuclease HARBI1 n=1 Tax=Anabrus simplex TaxID=316456 RepID=UPI0035A3AE15
MAACRRHMFEALLMCEEYLQAKEGREQPIKSRNDILELSEEQFLQRYRISKAVAKKFLEGIEDRLKFTTDRNLPVPPMQQLLIVRRYYASDYFQLIVGDCVRVCKATVCRIVHRVSAAIAALARHYIVFPSVEERPKVIKDFYELSNFPSVLGALDCIHIRILSPGGERSELFRNCKGYFSVNVQTIVAVNHLIRDIVACWPGSIHDSKCQIRADFEIGRITDGIHLGDNGYLLRKYLMTPFLQPAGGAQLNYNRAHIKARDCVERAYGVWKRRFPILSIGLRTEIQNSLTIIVAFAVLHNISILTKDDIPPVNAVIHEYLAERRNRSQEVDQDPPRLAIEEPRNAIVEQHFN